MSNLGLPNLVLAPEAPTIIRMKGRDFTITMGDTCRHSDNGLISKTLIYTDMVAGRNYTVEAYAFEIANEVDGAIIPRFLYINGKLISALHWQKSWEDNPLFYRCRDAETALLWGLAHAESLVATQAAIDSLAV